MFLTPERSLLVAALATGALFTRSAAAQTKAKCISSYTKSQVLRDNSQLLSARKLLLLCVRPACPAVLRRDCSRWLSQVEQLTPSVVLGARDRAGHDLVNVSVSMDGRPLTQRLDGKPIPVDPGVHSLRFEAPGHVPVNVRVVAREGQKARAIIETLDTAPQSRTKETSKSSPTAAKPSGIPPGTLAFGSVALVSLGAFGYFGATGLSRWDKCHGGGCTGADASYVNGRWVGADVALGLAVVSAGVATWFYLSRNHSPTAPQVGVAPGSARVRFSF